MATQNPAWGRRRGQGELSKPGHQIAASTVWQILHDAGIDPAPRRAATAGQRGFTADEVERLAAIFGIFPSQLTTLCANCGGHRPGSPA